MTRAEFERQYQVIRKVSEGAVRTHHAFASTGTVVMVHEIDPAAGREAMALAGMMARLEGQERDRILDVLDVDGATVIVTRFLLDHTSLRSWLEASRPPASVPPPEAKPDEPESLPQFDDPGGATEPGEFTRLFRAVEAPPPAPPPPAETQGTPASPVRSPAPEEPAEPPPAGPGEFTRMFRAAVAPEDAPLPPSGGPPRVSEEPRPTEEPAGPAVSPPARDSSQDAKRPDPRMGPPQMDRPTPPAETGGPGEFTRVFGAQESPGPAREAPEELRYSRPGKASDDDAEAYRARLGLRGVPPPPLNPEPTPLPPTDPAPGPGALELPRPPAGPPPPGEYTRIIQAADRPSGWGGGPSAGPSAGTPGQPHGSAGAASGSPPPPSPAKAQEPPISRAVVIWGLVGIFVLAAALVLVFLLARGEPSEEPESAPTEVEATL